LCRIFPYSGPKLRDKKPASGYNNFIVKKYLFKKAANTAHGVCEVNSGVKSSDFVPLGTVPALSLSLSLLNSPLLFYRFF
jgi:hypothetical protein